MNEKDEAYMIEPAQEWKVDFFRPEDAPGVTRLFLMVYGDGYPIKTFTDPDRLIEENASRRIISSVARTESGDIVGHVALFCSAPFECAYESGAGVVLPSYRGGKVALHLVQHSVEVAGKSPGIKVIFGEPVCNHIGMQKICSALGARTFALEVDLMPAGAYTQEKSASGRVSALLDFFKTTSLPQTIYVPDAYEDALRFLYDGFDYERHFDRSSEGLPVERRSRIHTDAFHFAQVARFIVHEIGRDFRDVFDREEKIAIDQGSIVLQVWLRLSWPWVGKVVNILRSRGYFLGGALPRWFDSDGLLMQKLLVPPNWEEIKTHSNRAVKILDMVRADWVETMAEAKRLGLTPL